VKTRKTRFENAVQETIRRQAKTRENAEKSAVKCGSAEAGFRAIFDESAKMRMIWS
jgi:hypothetical protein